jgi:hypothetical protein
MDKKWSLSGDSSLEKSGESIVEQIAMESDLGRLREVLGSERFDEIVKSKKDKV